ncbi:hypothetical protein [Halobaculum sp. D14]|uniref:DUF7847 domain-containing protein n=1 Tax=Halobaculum sp. D14 TaxID=3421642 RepID=UPI003EB8AA87
MALRSSLRAAVGALGRNPVIFAVTGLLALVQLPQLLAQWAGPLASVAVSLLFTVVYVVAVPYVQGGLIGMADEALDGPTSLSTFHGAGVSHYVDILVAYLLVFAGNLVVGGALFVLGMVALLAGLGGGAGTTVLVVVAVAGGVFGLAYLVVLAFIQFYGQAIVVDDVGGVDGLKRSVATVRANLWQVALYTVFVGVLGGVFGVVGGAASLLLSPDLPNGLPLPEATPAVAVVGAAAYVVLTTLFSALFLTFSVAFYRSIRGDDADRGGPNGADADVDADSANPAV